MAAHKIPIAERFWSKVNKNGPIPAHCPHLGCCWIWIGYLSKPGRYGVTSLDLKNQYAHRVSWMLVEGAIPEGLLVLHKCDNPPCVNPNHLFLGTKIDNARDMVAKGRQPKKEQYVDKGNKGETNIKAKLTNTDVLAIRRCRAAKLSSSSQLAKKYCVHYSTISNIIKGKTWKHI